MKNKLLIISSLLLATLILFCSCVTNKSASSTKTKTKITLNEVTHSVFYAPQYVAIELGLFEKAGIEIDLVNGGGSDKSMTALLSGDADIALMGPEAAVYIYNQGKTQDISIIAGLTKKDGSMLVGKTPDDDFSWEKLRGKTIIGGRKGSMPTMTLEHVLKQNNLTPGKDVIVDTGVAFNLMLGAFEGGEAEYVTLFEPTASMCVLQNKGYIVAAIGEYSQAPYTSYIIKNANLEKPKTKIIYQNFVSVIAQAQTWVDENSAEDIAKVIAPQFPETDIELLISVINNYKTLDVWNKTPEIPEDAFENMQDIISEAGELTKRVEYNSLVNTSLFK